MRWRQLEREVAGTVAEFEADLWSEAARVLREEIDARKRKRAAQSLSPAAWTVASALLHADGELPSIMLGRVVHRAVAPLADVDGAVKELEAAGLVEVRLTVDDGQWLPLLMVRLVDGATLPPAAGK